MPRDRHPERSAKHEPAATLDSAANAPSCTDLQRFLRVFDPPAAGGYPNRFAIRKKYLTASQAEKPAGR
jgi:hypothetical protein